MPEFLLTGGSGLIGARLIAALGSENVVALGRRRPAGEPPWIPYDLTAPELPDCLPRVETVIHLAQSRRYRAFPTEARDIFEVNVASTARLLDWARGIGVRRFIYASSGGVYGLPGKMGSRRMSLSSRQYRQEFYLASKRSGGTAGGGLPR